MKAKKKEITVEEARSIIDNFVVIEDVDEINALDEPLHMLYASDEGVEEGHFSIFILNECVLDNAQVASAKWSVERRKKFTMLVARIDGRPIQYPVLSTEPSLL